MKIKVIAVAKELGLKVTEVVEIAKEIGIDAKVEGEISPMDAAKIQEYFLSNKHTLEKENESLKDRIKYLQEKLLVSIDELIQEKFFQKLKEYEERIKQLERKNKELKEQLGYYE